MISTTKAARQISKHHAVSTYRVLVGGIQRTELIFLEQGMAEFPTLTQRPSQSKTRLGCQSLPTSYLSFRKELVGIKHSPPRRFKKLIVQLSMWDKMAPQLLRPRDKI